MLSKHLGKIFDYRRGIKWHKTIPRLHDPKDRNLPNYEKAMNRLIWHQCSKREN